MASIRPSSSPPVPSHTSAETWAARIAIGGMILGMAGFVVYDLVDSESPKTSEESAEVEDPPIELSAAEPLPTSRRPSQSPRGPRNRFKAPPPNRADEVDEESEDVNGSAVAAKPARPGRGIFSVSPASLRPNGRRSFLSETAPPNAAREQIAHPARPTTPSDRVDSPPAPAPETAPPPAPEQPAEQPEAEPAEQPEPTSEPDSPPAGGPADQTEPQNPNQPEGEEAR